MTNYQEEYIEKYNKAVLENFNKVRNDLENKDKGLMEKISKRSVEYNIDEATIIEEIKKYDTAVIPFVTSPARQNFYEKLACDMIQRIMDDEAKFKKLPNNKLYIVGGVVVKNNEQNKKTKSIDFQWEYQGYTIYAYHKYTKETGGSQDNQFKDLETFITEARDSKEEHTIFVAIADGDYYIRKIKNENQTKIQYLQELCTKKVIACHMDTLQTELDKAINNLKQGSNETI